MGPNYQIQLVKCTHGLALRSSSTRHTKVREIIIPEANKVRIIFRSGKEKEYSWQDRSRSESWTAEMRAKAARKTLERYKK